MARARRGSLRAFLDEAKASRTDDCILWPFTKFRDGYGQFERRGAHRVICEEVYGPCPNGMQARHACGQASCVNPRHLSWGTVSDNANDRRGHGTMLLGSKTGRSRLTEESVREIRQGLAAGVGLRELARQHNVSHKAIAMIRDGVSWGWTEVS